MSWCAKCEDSGRARAAASGAGGRGGLARRATHGRAGRGAAQFSRRAGADSDAVGGGAAAFDVGALTKALIRREVVEDIDVSFCIYSRLVAVTVFIAHVQYLTYVFRSRLRRCQIYVLLIMYHRCLGMAEGMLDRGGADKHLIEVSSYGSCDVRLELQQSYLCVEHIRLSRAAVSVADLYKKIVVLVPAP
ncbi:hypothetical protein BV25DRAFT_270231 [Artomyces pyxidatus]|uniref:Uncharacterized protein n=1 Tax=Artomyces pyxidatus TaxID=48021 RepID=A0ACB8T9F4_9AGAM|nr:hypothetical protein BV25DRAFT_270231 [Artomyces pyxidatus]